MPFNLENSEHYNISTAPGGLPHPSVSLTPPIPFNSSTTPHRQTYRQPQLVPAPQSTVAYSSRPFPTRSSPNQYREGGYAPPPYPAGSSAQQAASLSTIRSPAEQYPLYSPYTAHPPTGAFTYGTARSSRSPDRFPSVHHPASVTPGAYGMGHSAVHGGMASSPESPVTPYDHGPSAMQLPAARPPTPSQQQAEQPLLKKKRKRADAHQLKVLNEVYARTAFPSTDERQELARKLDMTPRSVQIWCVF